MTHSQTLTLLSKLNPDTGNKWALQNMLVALVQLCAQCCCPLTDWLDRDGRRKRLKGDLEADESRKTLRQLLALATAAVDACTWRENFHVTSVLVEDILPKSRKQTPEAIAKMLATRAANLQAQQDALSNRIEAYRKAS